MQKYISRILILSIFLYLFSGFFHPIKAMDQDLGRHFLAGEIILKTLQVPSTNLFSYTYPDFPFINHHWLSEVIFFLIFALGGFSLLQLFSTLIFFTAFALVFFYSTRKGNILSAAFVSILYLPILLERTDIRPEIFSFLFLSLFIVFLYKFREKQTKLIYLLPFIQLFWVNMHVYSIIGIFVLGLFIIDLFITRTLAHKKIFDPKAKTLILTFLLCCTASLINPNGLSGALYPLRVFENYGYTIQENQSLSFLLNYGFPQPALPYLLVSMILLFILLLLTIHKTRPIDWFLSVSFSIIAFSAVRNFPLFVIATFIPSTMALNNTFGSLDLSEKPLARNIKTLLPFILIGILAWQTFNVISEKGFGMGAEESAKGGVDFYVRENLKGPVFNNFDIGSYLEYRLYPRERSFIDGRPEAYPASFFKQTYIPMQEDPEVFAKIDQKYKFNTIFFPHTDQTPWAREFLPKILDNKNWGTVYLDDTIIILSKNNEENKRIIEKFGMGKNSLKPSGVKKDNFQSLLKLANFYHAAGLTKQEIGNYKEILELDPNFCPALQNLAVISSEKNDPSAQIYAQRFQQACN